MQTAAIAGFPPAMNAMSTLKTVLAEYGRLRVRRYDERSARSSRDPRLTHVRLGRSAVGATSPSGRPVEQDAERVA